MLLPLSLPASLTPWLPCAIGQELAKTAVRCQIWPTSSDVNIVVLEPGYTHSFVFACSDNSRVESLWLRPHGLQSLKCCLALYSKNFPIAPVEFSLKFSPSPASRYLSWPCLPLASPGLSSQDACLVCVACWPWLMPTSGPLRRQVPLLECPSRESGLLCTLHSVAPSHILKSHPFNLRHGAY